MTDQRHAAILGGGVIGGGWAARFALAGWPVRVFDPDPEAPRKIDEVLANARRSLPRLAAAPMPPEGQISFCDTLADAVGGAVWVQESVPERLDIKHKVLAEIAAAASPDTIIASSTSGFKPSELREGYPNPERVIVAHPFNPVYLLPLVEVVGDGPDADVSREASAMLESIGMAPLVLQKEIDAHIADRLLEAVWREALWLINDDIATTGQVDDAIRFGFGLRWAQMGLFETYRLAGGEAGMAHFIRQFGPCLAWPWTKLMDVPELTEALVEKIASQSDAQSGQHSIRDLERIRDDNVVGFLQVLKNNHWGIGERLAAHDEHLRKHPGTRNTYNVSSGPIREDEYAAPIRTASRPVLPAWIDYNGHMTEYRYLEVFADAADVLLSRIGMDADYVDSGCSYYTVETHINHIDEVRVGKGLHVDTQVLDVAPKKLKVFHVMKADEDGRELATAEQLYLHVDRAAGKACAAPDSIMNVLNRLAEAHAVLPVPELAGRYVGQRKTAPGGKA